MRILAFLSLMTLCLTKTIAQSKESFVPPNGFVLDYSITEDGFIIETTIGNFERVNSYQYTPTEKDVTDYIEIPGPEQPFIENGTLYIPRELSINHYYTGTEVKYHDDLFVATYDGVFLHGQMVNHPQIPYCDGTIRSFNDTVYICYDALGIVYNQEVQKIYTAPLSAILSFDRGKHTYGRIQDIWVLNDKKILLTTLGLFTMDQKLRIDTLMFTSDTGPRTTHTGRFISAFDNYLEGFINETYFQFDAINDSIIVLAEFENEIYDINKGGKLLVTTSRGVHNLNPHGSELTIPGDFHGCIQYKNLIYIYSNSGLFQCSAEAKDPKLEELFKIEFNRYSARISKDSLKIGSVNGLWSFSLKNMPTPINIGYNVVDDEFQTQKVLVLPLAAMLVIVTTALLVIVYRKPRLPSSKDNTNIEKGDIIRYIETNITTVTIVSLQNRFNLSQNKLYELCAPHPPGKLIRARRVTLLKELTKKGADIQTLAQKTGFSVEYIRKNLLKEIKKS